MCLEIARNRCLSQFKSISHISLGSAEAAAASASFHIHRAWPLSTWSCCALRVKVAVKVRMMSGDSTDRRLASSSSTWVLINALKTKRPPSRFAPKRNALTPLPSAPLPSSPFVAQATIALGQIQLAQFFIVSLVPLSSNRANLPSSALLYCCCCCCCCFSYCCCTGNCSLAAAQGCCILKNHQVAAATGRCIRSLHRVASPVWRPAMASLACPGLAWSGI